MKRARLSNLVMFPMMMSHFVMTISMEVRDTTKFKVLMNLHLMSGIAYYILALLAVGFWLLQKAVLDSDREPKEMAKAFAILYLYRLITCILATSVGFFMAAVSIGILQQGFVKNACFFILLITFAWVMYRYYIHFAKYNIRPDEDDHWKRE